MNARPRVSDQTRNNWWIVILLTINGLLVILTSIYFLFLPSAGYQGGRNPYHGIVLLFDRSTWDLVHTWTGVLLITTAAIHIPLHWSWIVTMTKRVFKILLGKCPGMNARGQFNLIINGVIGLSGLIAALSGLYFLFFPGGHGADTATATAFLFSRPVWDAIHTWAGTIMIAAAILHFAIHWRWVTKVGRKLLPGTKVSGGSYPEAGIAPGVWS